MSTHNCPEDENGMRCRLAQRGTPGVRAELLVVLAPLAEPGSGGRRGLGWRGGGPRRLPHGGLKSGLGLGNRRGARVTGMRRGRVRHGLPASVGRVTPSQGLIAGWFQRHDSSGIEKWPARSLDRALRRIWL